MRAILIVSLAVMLSLVLASLAVGQPPRSLSAGFTVRDVTGQCWRASAERVKPAFIGFFSTVATFDPVECPK